MPLGAFAYDGNGLMNTRVYDISIDETAAEPVYYVACNSTTGTGGCMYRSGYDSGVGISEMKTENPISIFPNPADTQIQISGVNLNSAAQLQIISMDGRVVKSETVNQSIINVSDLATGQYIVKITDGEGKMSVGMFVRF